MQTVIAWYEANRGLVELALLLISVFIGALQQTGSLKRAALELFLQAEKDFPGSPGPALMDQAVTYALTKVVPSLPLWLKPLATKKNVETFLAWAYRTFRTRLEKGAMQNTPAAGGGNTAPPQGQ